MHKLKFFKKHKLIPKIIDELKEEGLILYNDNSNYKADKKNQKIENSKKLASVGSVALFALSFIIQLLHQLVFGILEPQRSFQDP